MITKIIYMNIYIIKCVKDTNKKKYINIGNIYIYILICNFFKNYYLPAKTNLDRKGEAFDLTHFQTGINSSTLLLTTYEN